MRILIVSRYKNGFPGNISPFVHEQAIAIKEQGCEVDFHLVNGKGFRSYYFSRKDLNKKIEEFQPDAIHAHYGLCGITACGQKTIPVIITFHNGETLSKPVNFISTLYSLQAKYVIYVAQHIYDKCIFKRKNRHSIIPCGINLDEYPVVDKDFARKQAGLEREKKYILFGGAFNNLRKNYPLLNEAVAKLNRSDIETLEMKGLSRKKVAQLMCACDLFALPSKSEGSPQALKEAMACNCPIVATDIADIKFLLGNLPGHYVCSFDSSNVASLVNEGLNFNGRTQGRDRIIELELSNNLVAKRIVDIYQTIIK